MIDPIQAFLEANSLLAPVLPPSSRYHGVGTAVMTGADGVPLAYLRRRFVPPPERFALLQEHVVVQGDRIDNLAHRYLGDPEQYWRICDANGALRPDQLTALAGTRLRITLPEGVPGAADD